MDLELQDIENMPPPALSTRIPASKGLPPPSVIKKFAGSNKSANIRTPNELRPEQGMIPVPSRQAGSTRGRTIMSMTTTQRSASSSLDRSKPASQLAAPKQSAGEVKQFMQRVETSLDQREKLEAEIARLKTDAVEWGLERSKLHDEAVDLRMKLDDERREHHQQLHKMYAERTETEELLRSQIQAAYDDIQHLKLAGAEHVAAFNERLAQELDKMRSNEYTLRQQQQQQHMSELEAVRIQNERDSSAQKQAIQQQAQHQVESHQLQLERERQQLQTEKLEVEAAALEKARQTLEQAQLAHSQEKLRLEANLDAANRKAAGLEQQLEDLREKYEAQRHETQSFRNTLAELSANSVNQQSVTKSLQARIGELEHLLEDQNVKTTDMKARMRAAEEQRDVSKAKLLKEEMIRRKLHNQIQELKGNIRVFCRVRPVLAAEQAREDKSAEFDFPDQDIEGREILLKTAAAESVVTGATVPKLHHFSFDHVFTPQSTNEEVFEEISQLVQSALDGYNVCIFAYGQTGSGKTHTMLSDDGMIPRTVEQIFAAADSLKEKGWQYSFTGEFVEIYNEALHDLLASSYTDGSAKLEIRHDSKSRKTTITDLSVVALDSPATVHAVLAKASSNRRVAATRANDRSSRSHSVFILRIYGTNATTGHSCEGTLNLVDLAGSERLAHSQATGARLKETQAINKSLSYLGDVIYALGSSSKESAHVPFRNSKLTYLLQYSLSGTSKTLMLVNVSPLEPHINETISSLRFATKVNSTQIAPPARVSSV